MSLDIETDFMGEDLLDAARTRAALWKAKAKAQHETIAGLVAYVDYLHAGLAKLEADAAFQKQLAAMQAIGMIPAPSPRA